MDTLANLGAERALLIVRTFRAVMWLVCLAAAVAAWVMESPTVLALALVIAAEETWETSVVVAALRRQLHGAASPLHR